MSYGDKVLHLSTIFLAEFIGTAILVYVACMGSVNNFEHYNPTLVTMSVCSGLAPMIVINIFGYVSGAHINPAVTIAAVICKLINIRTAIVYILAQLFGSFFGYTLVRACVYTSHIANPDTFCMHLPQIDSENGFLIEVIITSILIFVICSLWDPRSAKLQDSVSLKVGFTVLILTFLGGPYTGGSMNPARSFGPAFYNQVWIDHWIYWFGPIFGSIIAAITFKYAFCERKTIETNENEIVESGNEEEQLKREV